MSTFGLSYRRRIFWNYRARNGLEPSVRVPRRACSKCAVPALQRLEDIPEEAKIHQDDVRLSANCSLHYDRRQCFGCDPSP